MSFSRLSYFAPVSLALIALSYAFYLHSIGKVGTFHWGYGVAAFLGAVVGHRIVSIWDNLFVFICFGCVIALGAVYAVTGQLVWSVVLVSIPAGLLIVSAFLAHRVKDIQRVQIGTQALLLATYVLVAILVMLELVSPYTFLVLLSFPLAIKNIKLMRHAAEEDDGGVMQTITTRTIRLVLVFTLLQVIGNVIAK